jgi:hypothetical protein
MLLISVLLDDALPLKGATPLGIGAACCVGGVALHLLGV